MPANPEEYIRASNGLGPAMRATISSERLPTDMDIITDTVENWPAKGIATSGTPDEDGVIIPGTECVFYYVLSGTIIHIVEFAPGYSDTGNTENQIVILKPTTPWADAVADVAEGGSSVTISDTPPPDAEEGDMWGDTSSSAVPDLAKLVGNVLMPVGSVYVNKVDSRNPADIFGFGTWIAYAEGRTIVGKAPSGTFDTAGATMGSETHTLTTAEMPSHRHRFSNDRAVPAFNEGANAYTYNTSDSGNGIYAFRFGADTTITEPTHSEYEGGGSSHNNIQPSTVAYIWERTA